jgi:hypothetical protein
MSLSSRLKQINSLSALDAMKEPAPAGDLLKIQDPVVYDDDELELPQIAKLDLPPVEDDGIEENYSHIVFITDYKLTNDVAKQLDKFLNIRNFEEQSFKNRNLSYLKQTNINYIWINLHDSGARDWVRKNINSPNGYKLIATYNIKSSAWVQDLEKYVDLTVSKKHISDVSYLTVGELFEEIRAKAVKIHPPLSGCLDKIFFKNRLIQKKN